MRGSAPGGSSQAAAARRCGTIGASWRFRGVAPGALATVGAAEAPIFEWRRAVLKRVALHTVSGAGRRDPVQGPVTAAGVNQWDPFSKKWFVCDCLLWRKE